MNDKKQLDDTEVKYDGEREEMIMHLIQSITADDTAEMLEILKILGEVLDE